jgi:hypothetical protein
MYEALGIIVCWVVAIYWISLAEMGTLFAIVSAALISLGALLIIAVSALRAKSEFSSLPSYLA